ncbi:ferritin-like domain-containing protein [Oscillatoria salina]|uniref:ferritin-like domain-containing protein n=1 Tax=Oscillatoria salina TaxID=331517 RepID=UPI0013BBD797|nr:DUF2202 domain-containing protein [Oscillatoria salina]MBZ8182891.1 DUF2202 domain-containing protein [Oscillatoria salina IIICB1]NET88932.1 DUF2202 domain-containing protein [Kamptonema sp. SIO1D9]
MLEKLKQALVEALHDEYKARATYRLVMQKFGEIKPFINILQSEERHIQALLSLFRKYQIPVPVDDWENRIQTPTSVLSACQAGVQAEIENGEMYQRLLALTPEYPDVQRVFLNLQRASQENHLRAFQRCVQRSGNSHIGRGKGRCQNHGGHRGRRHRYC